MCTYNKPGNIRELEHKGVQVSLSSGIQSCKGDARGNKNQCWCNLISNRDLYKVQEHRWGRNLFCLRAGVEEYKWEGDTRKKVLCE